MAVWDYYLLFEDGKAVTTTETTYSTTHLDMGACVDPDGETIYGDLGVDSQLWLQVKVVTPFTSTGASTLVILLQDSPDDTTFTTRLTSASMTTATLGTDGYWAWRVPLPMGLSRYLRLGYTVGTTIFTAGAFDAWIGPPAEKPLV